jgi:hypothetical protein
MPSRGVGSLVFALSTKLAAGIKSKLFTIAENTCSIAIVALAGICMGMLLWPASAHAGGLALPPAAKQGLNLLYNGQPEEALTKFEDIEKEHPDDALGYLLEADARWWQIYCQACEIKWNMLDAWPQPPRVRSDEAYLALTEKVIALAQAQITKNDSAAVELYAGMGWLLRARLLALREERLPTARAGVKARSHLMRSLMLDPDMADAYTGLGLYNYYVDTLSGMAKALRFLMGIPGGDKHEGIRQLHIAIEHGALTRVEASFYLAKNLRIYEHDFGGAVEVITPLVMEYPQNPVFHLMLGDFQRELHQTELAQASFHTAEQLPVSDAACAQRVHDLAEQAAALLTKNGQP